MDYRLCVSLCAALTLLFCWLSVFRRRGAVREVLRGRDDAA